MSCAVEHALDHTDAIAQAWWEQARLHWQSGQADAALASAQEAARVRSGQNRWLVWPQWEFFVGQMGRNLLSGHKPTGKLKGPATTFHVLNEALPAGGVTTMATRWIQSDPWVEQQHAVVLDDTSTIPARLQGAVHARGGRVWRPDRRLRWAERVQWLHRLLNTQASRVVLHIDPADVLCTAALAPPGGPAVLWVNHTAHSFSTGVSVADTVLNLRGSPLERNWSRHHRGAARIATLPIPVADARHPGQLSRQAVRQAWNLPLDSVVVLSIGSRFKFDPLEEPDFLRTWTHILQCAPRAVLCMVGFPPDRRWHNAQAQWGHRLRVLGPLQAEPLAQLLCAADIYAEGFPLGTTTALLESVNAGLPALMAPPPYGPPLGTDGVAIDEFWPRPDSRATYVQQALLWLNEPEIRQQHAKRMQSSVQAHHTGMGWAHHLARAYDTLPRYHQPAPILPIQPTDWAIHERWMRFRGVWGTPAEQFLSESIMRGWRQGVRLRPQALDRLLQQRRPWLAHSRRCEETALRGLSHLPATGSPDLRCLMLRGCRWINGQRNARRPGAYDEYRHMSDRQAGAER